MDVVTAIKVAKIIQEQLKSEEKRKQLLSIILTIVAIVMMLLSLAVYIVTNPIDAIFNGPEGGDGSNVKIGNYTEVEDTVWHYLKEIGFNDFGAAGVMGNIRVESSFNTASNNRNHYFGLFQWGGGRWDGNPLSLSSFAYLKGTSWTDLQTQLSFFEMECRSSYSRVYKQMQNADDVIYACDYFCTYYEVCVGATGNWAYSLVDGKPYQRLEDRRQYAEFYYSHYARV